MRIAFLIIILLHGLIHLLGFVKGIGLKEVKELTLPISKPIGYGWLITTFLFLIYGALFFLNHKYSWLIGLIAVAISQILVMMFWKDAKFGTIPNALILAISLTSLGYYSFQKRVQQETSHLLRESIGTENKILHESDILALPEPVKKWLHRSGAIGKPYIHVGKVSQIAELQMKPGQKDWMNATAIQFTAIDNPSFIWSVSAEMNRWINFQGRDKFENGKGEMLIKLNSLINIVNARGEKLDEGTIQRFLGEMVWFPSLALSRHIQWDPINDTTAKATISYKGSRGSGTFFFNSDGDVTKYSAMRFKGNEAEAKRFEWIMQILGYKTFEGIKVPAKMTSTWKLTEGDWTWLHLEVTDIKYNKNAQH